MPAPTGQLQRTIAQQRARLLSGDAQLQAIVVKRYQDATKRIEGYITALQQEIASLGQPVDPGKVFALERWTELRRQLMVEVATMLSSTGHDLTQAQADAVRLAVSDAETQITQAASLVKSARVNFAKLPTGAMEDLIGSMQPGSPLFDLFAAVSKNAPEIAEQALTDGLATGQGAAAVADAISKSLSMTSTRAMTIARTELLRSYRSSTLRTYQQNSDVLDGWQWSADLAGACAACLSLHGQIFPVSEGFFPSHPNCRCAAIPVVKGLDPLIQPGSGEDYFAGLSPDEQDNVLGPGGGAAYRAGDVSLGDFVAVRDDPKWGRSYSQGSLRDALKGSR